MKSLRSLVSGLVTNSVFLAVLLLAAGTLHYPSAWAYFVISVVSTFLSRWATRKNPDLEAERKKPGEGVQAWDRKFLGASLLLTVAMLIIAGLDAGRFHWAPRLSWGWAVLGALLDALGIALFVSALRVNRFFSSVVRIQSDRGHSVVSEGPYAVVRHPGNAGMILGTVGLPLLFLSAWSAIPALISAALLVRRTQLEDAFLAKELPGYSDYQQRTRFRLVPALW